MLNLESINQTVLGKIVADKQLWVEARKTSQPLAGFIDQLTPSDRDFNAALSGKRTGFILECKKASPSKGLIRTDFDPAVIAQVYDRYAAAISVLTDEKYFQGSFNFLPLVRSQVSVPVLCKDFIIDPYQIYLARHYQADAVLLMLSVLTDRAYSELAAVATRLQMGILTEVSNEEELERAIALGAKVVGINNRNLRDLSIDLDRTKQLAPRLPSDRIVICESGIHSHAQVKDLSVYANGFLVGSSLMSQDDVDLACRQLILGQNKVCGLTSPEAAQAAYQVGAVHGGLIFVGKSPRCVDIPQAKTVMAAAPLRYVGVFQNAELDTVLQTVHQLGLVAVQLHGQEDAAYIAALRSALPDGCQIWKAVAIGEQLPRSELHELVTQVDRILLDTQVGQHSGGTGQSFDWSLLDELDKTQLMLAGGINPDNAQSASRVGCLGLDLNSGVESAPGIKDADKLQRAFTALRAY
jgi:indole-3-glycerol phosphate synthase / phosphoribosylanthranilate isomerase